MLCSGICHRKIINTFLASLVDLLAGKMVNIYIQYTHILQQKMVYYRVTVNFAKKICWMKIRIPIIIGLDHKIKQRVNI